MIIRDLGIISIHMVWHPMALPESGLWKTGKDTVTNEHLVKCVKARYVKMAWRPDYVGAVCQFLFYLGELGHETCQICTWNGYGDH